MGDSAGSAASAQAEHAEIRTVSPISFTKFCCAGLLVGVAAANLFTYPMQRLSGSRIASTLVRIL